MVSISEEPQLPSWVAIKAIRVGHCPVVMKGNQPTPPDDLPPAQSLSYYV